MEKGNEGKLQATAEALKKLDLKEFQYHKKTVEDVVKELGTNPLTGLTSSEAEKRLEKYGQNVLDQEEEESLWDKIKESFEDTLVRILLLAAIISFLIALTGKYSFNLKDSDLVIGTFMNLSDQYHFELMLRQ